MTDLIPVLAAQGSISLGENFYFWLAGLIVLCPLVGFVSKLALQFSSLKAMWQYTDRICVLMMSLAFGMAILIGWYFLFSPEARDSREQRTKNFRHLPDEVFVNSQKSVNWLVFGKDDAWRYHEFLGNPERISFGHLQQLVAQRRELVFTVDNLRSEEELVVDSINSLNDTEYGYDSKKEELTARRDSLRERIKSITGEFALSVPLTKEELNDLEYQAEKIAHFYPRSGESLATAIIPLPDLQRRLEKSWLEGGRRWEIDFGIEFSYLTVLMLLMVTLVSTLIHIYSIGYMQGDKRYPRFFSYISLFTFGMLGLVVSNNLLLLYMFWEIMGLCSYLLIGYFFEKESASKAGLKAFMVTRIGDVGMFLGMMLLFAHTGTFNFNDMYEIIHQKILADPTGNFEFYVVTIGTLLLFLGPVGKSAQFPLHTWLPDAMEGPTPVSAMIHAATMVSGGVLLTARIFPMMTPVTMDVVAYIGGFTALFAATIALVQVDIKKVLAYSTISQLGFMMCAIGCGAWVAAVFHLLTHAFFKACLFLSAGSVIHGIGTNDMREMGGLRKKMPITFICMLLATVAISGVPFFSGFYSKDMIIKGTLYHGMTDGNYLPFIFLWVAAGMTAFYMFRLLFMTFFGQPRDQEKYDHAHESPRTITFALGVLAAFSFSIVWLNPLFNIEKFLITPQQYAVVDDDNKPASYGAVYSPAEMEVFKHKSSGSTEQGYIDTGRFYLASAASSGHEATDAKTDSGGHGKSSGVVYNLREATEQEYHIDHRAHLRAMALSIFIALVGIGLAFLFYIANPSIPVKLTANFKGIHRWLENKYYFDELYDRLFVQTLLWYNRALAMFDQYVIDMIVNATGLFVRIAAFFFGLFDKYVIDGAVNMVGEAAQDLGEGFQKVQTGKVQYYVIGIFICTIFIGMFLWAVCGDSSWGIELLKVSR
ncbi:NADH-quinone oxidoreductase subunit L [Planctomycetota bacterium]